MFLFANCKGLSVVDAMEGTKRIVGAKTIGCRFCAKKHMAEHANDELMIFLAE